ncbi:MAG: decaprenyl-phosphate phosphoribosyltransferase [Planctomycetota bacterium]|jgi:4-hydroxybenzoate polyprenyltransferase|nr:decaprenyl-phosphate phosphoribosyltransferase [Candidatus Woesearchaeota archaeon]MDP6385644.1 decaprenyl-phosphate phosphoribosyltransferase [Planctomycetota bacterium]
MLPLAILRSMRPHQWVKNVFVFAAFVFYWAEKAGAGEVADWSNLKNVLFAFAAFCLGASAIYLINDIMDVESDRAHPTKCKRPIAAGEMSVPMALVLSVVCVVGALTLALGAVPGSEHTVAWIVLAYMIMNLLYSLKLKHIVIIDSFVIAAGFIMRLTAGGAAGLPADEPLSPWIILCTFFLALFLAFCKRRAEIDLLGDGRGGHRKILLDYTQGFLDQITVVLAACTVITYAMWTVKAEEGQDQMVYTVPFVVFGLFRYLLLVQTQKGGGSPTRVLLGGDPTFVANCLAYVLAVFVIAKDLLPG